MPMVSYIVSFTTTVDRPELRGATYPVVSTGTKIPTRIWCPTCTIALNLVKGLLAGEDDFASEYVSSVQAWAETEGSYTKRTVRKYHVRSGREAAWRVS